MANKSIGNGIGGPEDRVVSAKLGAGLLKSIFFNGEAFDSAEHVNFTFAPSVSPVWYRNAVKVRSVGTSPLSMKMVRLNRESKGNYSTFYEQFKTCGEATIKEWAISGLVGKIPNDAYANFCEAVFPLLGQGANILLKRRDSSIQVSHRGYGENTYTVGQSEAALHLPPYMYQWGGNPVLPAEYPASARVYYRHEGNGYCYIRTGVISAFYYDVATDSFVVEASTVEDTCDSNISIYMDRKDAHAGLDLERYGKRVTVYKEVVAPSTLLTDISALATLTGEPPIDMLLTKSYAYWSVQLRIRLWGEVYDIPGMIFYVRGQAPYLLTEEYFDSDSPNLRRFCASYAPSPHDSECSWFSSCIGNLSVSSYKADPASRRIGLVYLPPMRFSNIKVAGVTEYSTERGTRIRLATEVSVVLSSGTRQNAALPPPLFYRLYMDSVALVDTIGPLYPVYGKYWPIMADICWATLNQRQENAAISSTGYVPRIDYMAVSNLLSAVSRVDMANSTLVVNEEVFSLNPSAYVRSESTASVVDGRLAYRLDYPVVNNLGEEYEVVEGNIEYYGDAIFYASSYVYSGLAYAVHEGTSIYLYNDWHTSLRNSDRVCSVSEFPYYYIDPEEARERARRSTSPTAPPPVRHALLADTSYKEVSRSSVTRYAAAPVLRMTPTVYNSYGTYTYTPETELGSEAHRHQTATLSSEVVAAVHIATCYSQPARVLIGQVGVSNGTPYTCNLNRDDINVTSYSLSFTNAYATTFVAYSVLTEEGIVPTGIAITTTEGVYVQATARGLWLPSEYTYYESTPIYAHREATVYIPTASDAPPVHAGVSGSVYGYTRYFGKLLGIRKGGVIHDEHILLHPILERFPEYTGKPRIGPVAPDIRLKTVRLWSASSSVLHFYVEVTADCWLEQLYGSSVRVTSTFLHGVAYQWLSEIYVPVLGEQEDTYYKNDRIEWVMEFSPPDHTICGFTRVAYNAVIPVGRHDAYLRVYTLDGSRTSRWLPFSFDMALPTQSVAVVVGTEDEYKVDTQHFYLSVGGSGELSQGFLTRTSRYGYVADRYLYTNIGTAQYLIDGYYEETGGVEGGRWSTYQGCSCLSDEGTVAFSVPSSWAGRVPAYYMHTSSYSTYSATQACITTAIASLGEEDAALVTYLTNVRNLISANTPEPQKYEEATFNREIIYDAFIYECTRVTKVLQNDFATPELIFWALGSKHSFALLPVSATLPTTPIPVVQILN